MDIATDFRIVYVNIDSIDIATNISKILIQENLAACCTIIPNVKSFFSWKDEICIRNEFMIMIKTHISKLDSLSYRVTELHTDEVPEIITVNLAESSLPYLDWLKSELVKNS
jgi:periplasmic divalent cation tolerance protein